MENNPQKKQLNTLIKWLWNEIRNLFQKIRHKHLAFLFFVALATVTWLLRALSDVYVAEIEYPVEFINLPQNRILTQAPIKTLKLQVKADGYTILSNRMKSKKALKYDVNTFALYSKLRDSTTLFALTGSQTAQLSSELSLENRNMQVIDISPDTLVFHFARIRKRLLPVIPQLASNPDRYADQCMANGEAFATPDSVEVSGPVFLVDSLKGVKTQVVQFHNLKNDGVKQVALQPIKQVKISPTSVKVTQPVDEFTEAEIMVPIISRNVPDSLSLKTFPRTVKLIYLITLDKYDKINEEILEAYVDYNAIDPSLNKKLRVELGPIPDYIHNISIIPRNVDFLIEK
ncbi:MAG: YbbR-like domain-containing protein [Bacteroidales bacterium]|nr:YbbR-like domain-containing protein [Bacteroidales bacterium]